MKTSLERSVCDLGTYVEGQFRSSCQLRFLVFHLSLLPYSLAFFLDSVFFSVLCSWLVLSQPLPPKRRDYIHINLAFLSS